MNNHHQEYSYLNLLKTILETGDQKIDRTGVGTKSIFGPQLKFDLDKSFPAITTKRLAWKAVVSELLWFLEGSGDEYRLREILHGERYSNKKTIWTDNAQADYWVKKKLQRHPGDLGRVYGVQWRKWRKPLIRINKVVLQNHDQILELVQNLKNDPFSRRHILSAWNPGELDLMALPPCHVLSQFFVSSDKKLSCHMYQRSADMFLGVPFNIASYALLTYMLSQVCNLNPGNLIISFGDAHIYMNHIDQVKEQLKREPYLFPSLKLNPDINDITKFSMNDIELVNYECHETIKAPMAV